MQGICMYSLNIIYVYATNVSRVRLPTHILYAEYVRWPINDLEHLAAGNLSFSRAHISSCTKREQSTFITRTSKISAVVRAYSAIFCMYLIFFSDFKMVLKKHFMAYLNCV